MSDFDPAQIKAIAEIINTGGSGVIVIVGLIVYRKIESFEKLLADVRERLIRVEVRTGDDPK